MYKINPKESEEMKGFCLFVESLKGLKMSVNEIRSLMEYRIEEQLINFFNSYY
jgi:hypothetical protein